MKIHRLSRQQLLALFAAATSEQVWILDTETDGLEVIGADAKHSAWWLGLNPLGTPNVFIISIEEYIDWGLEAWFKQLRFIGHNLRFDLHALDLVPEVPWKDTLVAAYFAHTSGRKSMDHFATVNGWTNIETPAALKQGRIVEVPESELFAYLANDCVLTAKMAQSFQLDRAEFDYAVERAVYKMERQGIRLLEERLASVEKELNILITDRLQTLMGAGLEGNPDSPIQVAQWLIQEGRTLPLTATGRPSTAKLALQRLVDNGDALAEAVIDYRKAVKLRAAFVQPLPRLTQNGLLYPRTNTTRTKTGRFSCDSPNLQQIPKRGPLGKAIRGCLTSPDNTGVISCDFSQVELRVAAAFADEPVLLEAFEQGRCPHTEVAAKMVGKTPDQITPEERFSAKAVNFGILNGMGASRLAFELKTDKRTAARFLNEYKRNLASLNSWMEGVWAEAEALRIARTVAGRTRIFASFEATRPAVSVKVQGSAAELMRHALVNVSEAGLNPFITVHDEILIGGREQKRAEELRECMETAANTAYPSTFGNVNFPANSSLGETWGDV